MNLKSAILKRNYGEMVSYFIAAVWLVNGLFCKLLNLVSRHELIVARQCGPGSFDCSPAFNPFYRMVFLCLFLVFNSVMLFPLHEHVFSRLSYYHLSYEQLQGGHLVFVGVNCVLALFLNKRMAIEYLGQINMLALVTILFLTLLLFVTVVLPVDEWVILSYLFLLTIFIIKEYFRRMQYAGIVTFHKFLTAINIVCLLLFLAYVFH